MGGGVKRAGEKPSGELWITALVLGWEGYGCLPHSIFVYFKYAIFNVCLMYFKQ